MECNPLLIWSVLAVKPSLQAFHKFHPLLFYTWFHVSALRATAQNNTLVLNFQPAAGGRRPWIAGTDRSDHREDPCVHGQPRRELGKGECGPGAVAVLVVGESAREAVVEDALISVGGNSPDAKRGSSQRAREGEGGENGILQLDPVVGWVEVGEVVDGGGAVDSAVKAECVGAKASGEDVVG